MLFFWLRLVELSFLIPDLHPTLSCKGPAWSFTTSSSYSHIIQPVFQKSLIVIPRVCHNLYDALSHKCHRTIDWLSTTYATPIPRLPHREITHRSLAYSTLPQYLVSKQITHHPLPSTRNLVQDNQYHILSRRMDSVCSESLHTRNVNSLLIQTPDTFVGGWH